GRVHRGPTGALRVRIAPVAADPVYRREPHGGARDRRRGNEPEPARAGGFLGILWSIIHGRQNLGASAMTNTMWGGRFGSGPDAVMEEINASIDVDRRLYRQDIAASKAHAAMLARQSIITADDAAKIAHGLDTILSEIESGRFEFKRSLEDIHMNVEARLAELIGPAAGRLHTARSRNDQVATDFRLWLRATIDAIDAAFAQDPGA